MEDGLIKIVTLLKDNKTMGDAHDDAQFEGIGGDVPLYAHKFYEPGGYSQTDTNEHRHTMTTKVTGSIEDQLVYQRRTGNVT